MATLSPPRPHVKTETTTRELLTLSDGTLGLMLETVCGRKVRICCYHLERIPCDDVAYTLTKFSYDHGTDATEPVYHINLDDDTCGCSCKGYLAHSHCKHHSSLASLRKEGAL